MIQTPQDVAVIAFGVFVIAFVLEHVGRRNNMVWLRVSWYVSCVVQWLRPIAVWLGQRWADAMTFLAVIDLYEMVVTFNAMIEPLWQFMRIPFVIRDAAIARANHVATVWHMRLGQTIFAVLALLVYLFPEHVRLLMVVGAALLSVVVTHLWWIKHEEPVDVAPARRARR